MVTASIASEVGSLLQAHQQVQWEAEQHSNELKAAQWCEEQIQAVRREAAEATAAAEAICDSRCAIPDDQAAFGPVLFCTRIPDSHPCKSIVLTLMLMQLPCTFVTSMVSLYLLCDKLFYLTRLLRLMLPMACIACLGLCSIRSLRIACVRRRRQPAAQLLS